MTSTQQQTILQGTRQRPKIAAKLVAVAVAFGLVTLLLLSKQIFEHVDAGDVVVIQYPSGGLSVVTQPGYAMQWFGSVEHFRRSSQYNFSGGDKSESIKTRFNDGAHGYITGSIRYDLPDNPKQIIDLYRTYRTQEAIDKQLVGQNITKAVYMTGPLMSSKESYSDRRNELIANIEDQATRGIFQTVPKDVEIEDPITQTKKWSRVVDIRKDPKTGVTLRQEESPIQRFGVSLYNLSISEVKYDDIVEKQIAAQQAAIMQVQTAIAKSKEAEQQALTIAKQGEAGAAEAKWKQEALKATAVTQAEQEAAVQKTNALRDKLVAETAAERERNVADFAKQAAEFTKAQQIALGEGEAKRKQLVMQANGALEQKLEAWKYGKKVDAEALASYRGNIVPTTVFGGGATQVGTNSLNTFLDMQSAKAAKELSLDMGVTKFGTNER